MGSAGKRKRYERMDEVMKMGAQASGRCYSERVGERGGGSKPLILPIHYPPPLPTPLPPSFSSDIPHIRLYFLASSLSVPLRNSFPFSFDPTQHEMSEYFLFI
jgi:hypothetical protein